MVYTKRPAYRRKRYVRRTTSKTITALARTAAKRAIAQVAERKYIDLWTTAGAWPAALAFLTTTAAWQFQSIPIYGIVQGTTRATRLGQEIYVTSIDVICYLDMPAAGLAGVALNGDQVRMQVILDKKPNNALAAVADVYDTTTMLAYRNQDKLKRFQILQSHDHLVTVQATIGGPPPTTVSAATLVPKTYTFNVPVNKKFTFQGVASTVADMNNYNVFVAYCNVNASAIRMSMNYRVHFRDM